MVIKDKIYISYLDEERTLHIYLPDKINQNLPVLYMYDGHNLFNDEDATYGKCWGLKDYLDKNKVDIIVVGIECSHKDNQRISEFSPYSFTTKDFGKIKGTGRKFTKFMVEELKPYIDENYPTLSDFKHTYIGGSSMGGLMSLYAGIAYPKVYSKIVSISPFLYHMQTNLIRRIKNTKLESVIYISWGECEGSLYHDNLRSVSMANHRISYELVNKGAKVFPYLIYQGEHNETCWEKEIPTFFRDLELAKK